MWRNNTQHWGDVTKAVHWLTVVLIIGMLIAGFSYAEFIEDVTTKVTVMQWHKSFGILILALSVGRLAWRWGGGAVPTLPPTTTVLERRLAAIVHGALYALLLAMPLVGWLVVSSSTRNIPTVIFGTFTLPRLVGPSKEMHEFFEEAHEMLAFVLIAVFALHVAAALKHHVVLKDDVLRRMLPKWAGGR